MKNATKSKELQQDNKTYCIKLNYVQYEGNGNMKKVAGCFGCES